MVKLGITENQKEQELKKAVPDSTVVVLPTAPPPANSTCCTQRVKICVAVLCFIGAIAVASVLLSIRLGHIRRHLIEEKMPMVQNDFEEYKGSDHVGDSRGDQDGNRHGDHRGGFPGDRPGDREGDCDREGDGDRDDDHRGDHRRGQDSRHGDHDSVHHGDHRDSGEDHPDPSARPPPPPQPLH